MNTLIHPSAIISNKAQIGNNTTIGPFTIVEDNVIIGDDCIIGPNVGIYEGARIGKRVKIYQGASISNHPQDLKFANEESIFEVGDDTVIREFATLHRGTKETKISKVGKNCLLMAYSHVAHDCMVGDNCILANSVQLGGHVEIGDWVIIGGGSMVHQFGKVGMHAMIGGGYRAVVDVPPFVLTAGDPLKFEGLNTIGLRRRGFTNDDIYRLKNIYQIIFSGDLNLTQAKQKISEDFKDDKLANAVLEFLGKSTRGIIKKVNWKLIEYNTYTGKHNMEFDLQLVKNCFSNEAFLRFYGWEPHCISLGANQSYDDINQELATKNNIDVVKRPTGGRAILHSDELTYSVVMPNNQQLSGRTLYEKISEAIIIGLAKYDSMLEKVMLENQQPNFQQLLNQPSGSLCFASTAKSEIKFEGKKLVGSAQRKLGNTILQHGSILIGPNHKSLVDYLNLDEELKLNLQNEMEMKTTEISTILNKNVDIMELQKNIIFGFNKVFNSQLSFNAFASLPTL